MLLDEVTVPIAFRRTKPFRLVGWSGDVSDSAFQSFAREVQRLTNSSGEPDTNPESPVPEDGRGTPSARLAPTDKKMVFVSYRREDSADITGRITDHLVQRFGRESVFKDVDSIPLGIDFREYIQTAVSRCAVLLAIIGRNWTRTAGAEKKSRLEDPRDHLRIEVQAALDRNIPVIPVLVQGVHMPAEHEVPDALRSLVFRNGIAVRPDPDFHIDMQRLIRGIQDHCEGK